MASHPCIVRGRSVLEIGAGCGACGILAARLGAARVVLTDYVDAVLLNLRDCVHLNSGGGGGGGAGGGDGPSAAVTLPARNGGTHGHAAATAAGAGVEVEDGWDPEDASECGSEEFGELLSQAAAGATTSSSCSSSASWDAPPMHVRFYDWQESVAALGQQEHERQALAAVAAAAAAAAGGGGDVDGGGSIDHASNDSGCPSMDTTELYDAVIGTDILYEW